MIYNQKAEALIAQFKETIRDDAADIAGYFPPIGTFPYHKFGDYIVLPPRYRYADINEYYHTVFHELVHWTAPRLKRKIDNREEEETIADIGATLLCAHCRIPRETLDVQNRSFGQAFAAARYILDLQMGPNAL